MAEQAAGREERPVFILKDLIHNHQALDRLHEMGVSTAQSVDDVPQDGLVIFRAHGESPASFDRVAERGLALQDATCPIVERVQEKARLLEAEGYQVVIFGHKDHAEAIAIKAHTERGIIIDDIAEARALPRFPRIGAVTQTTMYTGDFEQVCELLATKCDEFKSLGTICNFTQNAQAAAREILGQVEAMVVIGGRHSSNTKQLVKVCSERVPTYWIEVASELQPGWFAGVATVGVTAGASTPEWLTLEVMSALESIEAPAEKGATPAGSTGRAAGGESVTAN
jgi:(E)-4-hydroxy-3-methyl-but-2-enyl pyrophosphate reductase